MPKRVTFLLSQQCAVPRQIEMEGLGFSTPTFVIACQGENGIVNFCLGNVPLIWRERKMGNIFLFLINKNGPLQFAQTAFLLNPN